MQLLHTRNYLLFKHLSNITPTFTLRSWSSRMQLLHTRNSLLFKHLSNITSHSHVSILIESNAASAYTQLFAFQALIQHHSPLSRLDLDRVECSFCIHATLCFSTSYPPPPPPLTSRS